MSCNDCKKNLNSTNSSSAQGICKKCHCLRIKDVYKRRGRSYRNTKKAIKENSECAICKENNPILLEFDHIEKASKKNNIAHMFGSEKIKQEILKCRILCIKCHRIHSHEQRKKEQQTKIDSIQVLKVNEDEGKVCNGYFCKGSIVSVDLFYKRKNNGLPKGMCKKCLYISDHKKRSMTIEYINSIKNTIGMCSLCKLKIENGFEMCFDFDHIDMKSKICSVSNYTRMRFNNSLKQKIDNEIAKCRLLCCNCHKKHTHTQLSYI